ncbi:MAG: HigA family addiction module antitoxin [Deinococcales bacterium]
MKMFNPPHPGEVLRELCLEPLGLTITEAAKALGVSRKTLSSLVNGRSGISPEMAIRLAKALIPRLKVGLISKCIMISGWQSKIWLILKFVHSLQHHKTSGQGCKP